MSDLSRWCLAHYQALHDFAGPVATAIAAGAAVFVTWRLGSRQVEIARRQAATAKQQAQLASVRLQHDLFEKRIAVFDAVRDLVLEAYNTKAVSANGMKAFVEGTQKSAFLFDYTVTDYISEMRNRAGSLKYVAERLEEQTLPVDDDERGIFAEKRHAQFEWFVAQFEVLIPKFMGALALEKDIATRLPLPPSRTAP